MKGRDTLTSPGLWSPSPESIFIHRNVRTRNLLDTVDVCLLKFNM